MPILDSDHLEDEETEFLDSEEIVDDQPNWLTQNIEKNKRKLFGKSDKPPSRPRGRKKNLKEPVADQIVWLGTFLTFARPITGIAVVDQADEMADALNELAKTNDRLYRMLERMTGVGKWGKLGNAVLPVMAAAYVEAYPKGTMLSMQAVTVMERGLSESAMAQIEKKLEKKLSKQDAGLRAV